MDGGAVCESIKMLKLVGLFRLQGPATEFCFVAFLLPLGCVASTIRRVERLPLTFASRRSPHKDTLSFCSLFPSFFSLLYFFGLFGCFSFFVYFFLFFLTQVVLNKFFS